MTFINVFIIRLAFVHGPSMKPTFEDGSLFFVFRIYNNPENGDIVVFDSKTPFGISAVKRVIAVGGQSVRINNNMVYLDDQLLYENYLYQSRWSSSDLRIDVPEGHVFVMGDNRDESKDSRDFGCIPAVRIIGKAILK